MLRDRLRRLVRRAARRVVQSSPRIPSARAPDRAPPTTRTEWKPEPEPEPPDLELPAEAVLARMANGEDIVLVDVRELHELWSGHARGAILAPMSRFEGLVAALPDGPLLALYCAAGVRSYGIADYLRKNGRPNAWSIPEGFGGVIDAGAAWLQPATHTDWKLLQHARLTEDAARRLGFAGPLEGTVQAVEAVDSGYRLALWTTAGHRIPDLSPTDLTRA